MSAKDFTVKPKPVVPPLAKPGQVIILKFPDQLHAYMEQHALEPLAWRGHVLVLQKATGGAPVRSEEEQEQA